MVEVAFGFQEMVHELGQSVTATHWDSLLRVSQVSRAMAAECSRCIVGHLANLEGCGFRAVSQIVGDSFGNPGSVGGSCGRWVRLVQTAGRSGALSIKGGTVRLIGIWLSLAVRSNLLAVGSGGLLGKLASNGSCSKDSNDGSLRELHFEWLMERLTLVGSKNYQLNCRMDERKRVGGVLGTLIVLVIRFALDEDCERRIKCHHYFEDCMEIVNGPSIPSLLDVYSEKAKFYLKCQPVPWKWTLKSCQNDLATTQNCP